MRPPEIEYEVQALAGGLWWTIGYGDTREEAEQRAAKREESKICALRVVKVTRTLTLEVVG